MSADTRLAVHFILRTCLRPDRDGWWVEKSLRVVFNVPEGHLVPGNPMLEYLNVTIGVSHSHHAFLRNASLLPTKCPYRDITASSIKQ